MRCRRCPQETPPDAAFCPGCGVRLSPSLACPQCGAATEPAHKFCKQCGGRLGRPARALDDARPALAGKGKPAHLAEKIRTSRGALEGERKQVTVLFADLRGSMEVLADRDPEDARRILDTILERMMKPVQAEAELRGLG